MVSRHNKGGVGVVEMSDREWVHATKGHQRTCTDMNKHERTRAIQHKLADTREQTRRQTWKKTIADTTENNCAALHGLAFALEDEQGRATMNMPRLKTPSPCYLVMSGCHNPTS